MGWIIAWVILVGIVLVFNYATSKNNEKYDRYIKQDICMKKYINSQKNVFVKYIGEDRNEIECNQYTLIVISITDDNKIKVELADTYILYDDLKHFNYDWRFEDD